MSHVSTRSSLMLKGEFNEHDQIIHNPILRMVDILIRLSSSGSLSFEILAILLSILLYKPLFAKKEKYFFGHSWQKNHTFLCFLFSCKSFFFNEVIFFNIHLGLTLFFLLQRVLSLIC